MLRPSTLFCFAVRDYKCNVLKHDVLGNNKSKSNYPHCHLSWENLLKALLKSRYTTLCTFLWSVSPINKMNEVKLKWNNPSESVLALLIIIFSQGSSCLITVLEFFWESEANSKPLTHRIYCFPFLFHQMSISIQQQLLCHLSSIPVYVFLKSELQRA